MRLVPVSRPEMGYENSSFDLWLSLGGEKIFGRGREVRARRFYFSRIVDRDRGDRDSRGDSDSGGRRRSGESDGGGLCERCAADRVGRFSLRAGFGRISRLGRGAGPEGAIVSVFAYGKVK